MEMQEKMKGDNANFLLRTTSCVGEPQVNAAQSMKARDLRLFTDLVNCLDEDGKDSFPLSKDHWINQPVEGDQDRTLLMSAINDHLHHFIEVLLKAGARADLYSHELGVAPLHQAVQSGDLTSVKLLLDGKDRGGNVASVNKANKTGRTALHMAAEQRDVDIIHFLLTVKEIDVDPKDNKGSQTPLYLAVKSKHPQIVEMLIENGASAENVVFGKPIHVHLLEKMPGFDLASIKVIRAPLVRQSSGSVLEMLVDIADRASRDSTKEEEFVQQFKDLILQVDTKVLNTSRSSGLTLLQRCAVSDLGLLAEVLLAEGVDPNYCPEDGSSSPVHLAAYRGNSSILKFLAKYHADFTVIKTSTEETVLHRLLIKDDHFETEKFTKSLKFLLSEDDVGFKTQIDKIINRKDLVGNTALHYATQRWGESTVRLLLERGANIGIKNQWGEVPIHKILPSTMESFLDEYCLESQLDVNHEDFELTFKYNFLAPPVEALPADVQGPHYEDTVEKEKIKYGEKRFALPETESLWYMGQSKEHRYLLKHPVITSFLWCKWTRIRRFVNRNLRFYCFFVMILSWFVFEEFGGHSLKTSADKTYIPIMYAIFIIFSIGMLLFILKDWINDAKDLIRKQQLQEHYRLNSNSNSSLACLRLIFSNWIEALLLISLVVIIWLGHQAITPALIVLLTGLIIREMFQMAVSLRRYILTVENWLEAILLILVILLLIGETNGDFKRHLAAIALLLSWAELITFVARHPRLTRYNVYVTMFYKVLTSFFFFLLWYAFFILAFGLGFYIMLHKDIKVEHETNKTAVITADKEEESGLQEFFDSPFLSIVKTCTMFIGELEFSDIPINRSSSIMYLSYVFFLVFVFLIVVVLMNLLNGLAVSDTGVIQEQAEVVAYLSRVETISYAESLLLGDPFDFLSSVPAVRWMSEIPSFSCFRQLYRSRTLRRLFQRITGAQGILLFYNYLPDRCLLIKPNARNHDCLKAMKVGDDIVEAAKAIVLAKEKQNKSNGDIGEELIKLREKSVEVEKQLVESKLINLSLEKKIDNLEHKLDLLLRKF